MGTITKKKHGEIIHSLDAGNGDIFDIVKIPSDPEQKNKALSYDTYQDQLDALWHDIDDGLFGDAPKYGQFYLKNKAVKI